MRVVFAQTRYHYQPYDDFFQLVSLSGFDTCYLDQAPWHDPQAVVIATPKNGEWEGIPRNHKCRFIWWMLERGHREAPIDDMSNPYKPDYVDEVWASDPAMAHEIGARFIFLGGHRAFGELSVRGRDFDYITLMANIGRRNQLFKDLAARNLKSADLPQGTWGVARRERLMRSKLLISAHQDELPWMEPIRFVVGACYGVPIVSEVCASARPWQVGMHYMAADINQLAMLAQIILDNEVMRARIAAEAWRLVCVDRTFEHEVRAAL